MQRYIKRFNISGFCSLPGINKVYAIARRENLKENRIEFLRCSNIIFFFYIPVNRIGKS